MSTADAGLGVPIELRKEKIDDKVCEHCRADGPGEPAEREAGTNGVQF